MTYGDGLQGRRGRNRLYIGVTSDLRRRVKAHRDGLSRTTRRLSPMQLVYYESYREAADAWEREKALEQFGGAYRELVRRIRSSRLVVLTSGGAG